ncbi:MAG: hypothetical protein ACLQPD_21855 [Desulfomonilaceae bacterium]
MKKKIRKDSKSIALPTIAFQGLVEPLSPDNHPQDITAELERVLETARQRLTVFGEHSEMIIIYASDKKLLLFPELRDHRDEITARVMIEDFMEKYCGLAVIVVWKGLLRPINNTFKKDPRPKLALVAAAKNGHEHLLAVQIFHQENGHFSFRPVEIIHLDENSSAKDTWLSHLEFKESFSNVEPVGNC